MHHKLPLFFFSSRTCSHIYNLLLCPNQQHVNGGGHEWLIHNWGAVVQKIWHKQKQVSLPNMQRTADLYVQQASFTFLLQHYSKYVQIMVRSMDHGGWPMQEQKQYCLGTQINSSIRAHSDHKIFQGILKGTSYEHVHVRICLDLQIGLDFFFIEGSSFQGKLSQLYMFGSQELKQKHRK